MKRRIIWTIRRLLGLPPRLVARAGPRDGESWAELYEDGTFVIGAAPNVLPSNPEG